MEVKIEDNWKSALSEVFEKGFFNQLADFVKEEYSSFQIFPPGKEIFNAFWHCPLPKVKVVILGQDPYHGPGQAHGLSFRSSPVFLFPPVF